MEHREQTPRRGLGLIALVAIVAAATAFWASASFGSSGGAGTSSASQAPLTMPVQDDSERAPGERRGRDCPEGDGSGDGADQAPQSAGTATPDVEV